jgi:hypothetical protein
MGFLSTVLGIVAVLSWICAYLAQEARVNTQPRWVLAQRPCFLTNRAERRIVEIQLEEGAAQTSRGEFPAAIQSYQGVLAKSNDRPEFRIYVDEAGDRLRQLPHRHLEYGEALRKETRLDEAASSFDLLTAEVYEYLKPELDKQIQAKARQAASECRLEAMEARLEEARKQPEPEALDSSLEVLAGLLDTLTNKQYRVRAEQLLVRTASESAERKIGARQFLKAIDTPLSAGVAPEHARVRQQLAGVADETAVDLTGVSRSARRWSDLPPLAPSADPPTGGPSTVTLRLINNTGAPIQVIVSSGKGPQAHVPVWLKPDETKPITLAPERYLEAVLVGSDAKAGGYRGELPLNQPGTFEQRFGNRPPAVKKAAPPAR